LLLSQNCWYNKWFEDWEVTCVTQAGPGLKNAFELAEELKVLAAGHCSVLFKKSLIFNVDVIFGL